MGTQLKKPGFIYLVRSCVCSGCGTCLVKIGASKHPRQRHKELDGMLPFETELIHCIATNNMAWAEDSLHQQYAAQLARSEWFKLTATDLNELQSTSRLDGPEPPLEALGDSERQRTERVQRLIEGRRTGKSTRELGSEENLSPRQVHRILETARAAGVEVDPPLNKIVGKDGRTQPARRVAVEDK
jgi:hypothetical protein